MRNTYKFCLSLLLLSSAIIGCGKKERPESEAQPTAPPLVITTEAVKTSCKADFTLEYGEDFDINKVCTYDKKTKLNYEKPDTKKEGKSVLSVNYTEPNGNMGLLKVSITVKAKPKPSPTPEPKPEENSSQPSNNVTPSYQEPSYQQPSYQEPEHVAPATPSQPETNSTPNYSDSTTTSSMQVFAYDSYGGESGAYSACQSHLNTQGGGSCYVNSNGTGYVYFK